ncbi:invasion associated locus B family protein [Paracoccus saliphilus]|uniref:Invasion associated locus B family protein n=1 Tax=Paracoccus saliphilus TaxID=405559 RepID=A0AA46A7H6_9RHOB|nr:invasion associated locus B family protein [Paracoccus saliphilus]WCR04521.1 invasion associated locus B family protein [Paracoccus saliphilus]SIT13668.1 Invasion protein IalB, involved in pathogenesis [Paracoccus saliphilus]
MSIKPSHTLLAALAVIAAPAFAQDAETPETDAPASDGTVQLPAEAEGAAAQAEELANEAEDAAAEAEAAIDDAAKAVTGAEEAPAEESAETEASESTEGEAAPDAAEAADDAATTEDAATADEATDEAAPADTTEAAETEEAAPTAEETAPTEGAPAGEEAAAEESGEPETGSYYAKSTHQDWTIRCIRAEEGTDPCELYQLLKDSEGNSVAEMTLIPLSNGDVAAGATMVAPLETDLTRGLSLSIDNGEMRGYPFSFCAPVGCVSRMGFTDGEVNELKRGAKATISLLPFGADPENPVNLDLSLAGFTAAFDEMSTLAAEAQAAARAQAEADEAPAE